MRSTKTSPATTAVPASFRKSSLPCFYEHPVWIGVLLGLAGAVTGAQVLTRFVYATSVREPATYAGVAGVLIAVAAAAAYLPARRAAAADPVSVLRTD